MKFGQVSDPEAINFELPADHADTATVLAHSRGLSQVAVGCAKWNKTDLKNFYPKGTKDELSYYSTQFNSIELNATFYQAPTRAQVLVWKEKTPPDFRFFPKIPNTISHFKRLKDTQSLVEEFCDAVSAFEEKLGMVFLQMHDNFKPKDLDRVLRFVEDFPVAIPLGVELRNQEWFADGAAADTFCQVLSQQGRAHVLVDTAGRRDMLHMRLTSPVAFVRYVGANHPSDYPRLDCMMGWEI
ncbi:MAG: DUF72 domain-containing protein [Cytophagales bacterium]|nr:DUF72 domain-containing protein [Cytophagales bacterium]